jgi:hypothetical protein
MNALGTQQYFYHTKEKSMNADGQQPKWFFEFNPKVTNNNPLYWSDCLTNSNGNLNYAPITSIQALPDKKATFTINYISYRSGTIYLISDKQKYIQWNDDGSIQASTYDASTSWDEIKPSSAQHNLTFIYTTVNHNGGFKLQTITNMYLKLVTYGNVQYIRAQQEMDDFGTFIQQ